MSSTPSELQRRTIESLESRLEKIALLPAVISRLAALDLNSSTAADEIIALVRSDPPLALRLMRLANYRSQDEGGTDTIPRAIVEVGTRNLANLVLSLSVIEVFVPRTRGQRNLWIHSIQTAITASRLAILRPDLDLEMEQCFLAGLLHDIGRFVIFEHRVEEMALLDEAEVDDPRELIETELKVCGFDHAALGYEVCRRWCLPETVCEMVRVHHMYGENKSSIPPEVATLVRLVQQADCFSFGLLRDPTSSFLSDAERGKSIETSLHLLTENERIVPATRLAGELREIDREARLAAAVINIAYP